MNWKFWKKAEVSTPQTNEVELLKAQVQQLTLINQLKDRLILQKEIESNNFRQSAYATLAGITLAHGGEYILNLDFTNAAVNNDLLNKLVIQAQPDNTMKFSFVTEEVEVKDEAAEETSQL